ncbi:MAG: Maf family protein [Synergistaceae bacterium]|nr:Maf family protein [Synergistaceae bacterium]
MKNPKIDIVLASGSLRRRELLRGLGWSFRVVVPEVDESARPGESPEDLCIRLSGTKARSVFDRCRKDVSVEKETLVGGGVFDGKDAAAGGEILVIAADTVVVTDGGGILGKPVDDVDSLRMLRLLQGRSHEVLTGVSVLCGERSLSVLERTVVTFRFLSDADMAAYVATAEGADKAGAYAIQGRGSLMVSSIKGDYFNVVGLPLCRLGMTLEELGMTPARLWAGRVQR